MDKKTITQIATAALITTAGITVTNNLKPLNITGSGTEVKAATTQSAQEFIDKAAPAAINASSKYGTYTSVMMAQAAVESGWGNSTLSQEPNNNLFGVKGSYNGQSVSMKTGEYGSNGYYTTTANFRKYPSYEESFNDNGSLLRNQMGSYYSGTWVENADSAEDATENGLQGKYATAPNYSDTLNKVIDTYNLKQYDPETTEVNETKTVTNTTPITDAPVDSDVANQVGTAREGQQLNVTKYITYKNGVKHAYVGTGWVNNTAFATTDDTTAAATTDSSATTTAQQATTNSAATTTNIASATQQTTATPATTQQVATTTATSTAKAATSTTKKTQAVQQPVATQTKTVEKPAVTQTKAVQSATVSQAPTAKTVEAVVKTATPKTTTATKNVEEVAKTTTSTVTKAAPQTKKVQVTEKVSTSKPVTTTQTKAVEKTVSTKDVDATVEKTNPVKSVVKEAEVVTPAVDEKKNDVVAATKAVEKEATKQAETKTTVKASVAKVATVAPKAAVATTDTKSTKTSAKVTAPVKEVKTTSKSVAVTVSQKSTTKKTNTAKVVSTKQVTPTKSTYKIKTTTASTSKVNSNVAKLTTTPIVKTGITEKVSAQASQIDSDNYVIKARGVLTINAKPDYGVAIWTVPGKKRTSRYLQNGTSWKFFKIAMINGEKWYNLGGNQWVPAKAVMVR